MPGEKREITLLDTSTAVALIVEDHESHLATLKAVQGRRLGLAGHAWFETYSVLTRLPAGLRRSPADAAKVIARNFPESAYLGEPASVQLAVELARLGISGGAVYDALVGAAARQHGRRLMSSDARAQRTYDALGVTVEVID